MEPDPPDTLVTRRPLWSRETWREPRGVLWVTVAAAVGLSFQIGSGAAAGLVALGALVAALALIWARRRVTLQLGDEVLTVTSGPLRRRVPLPVTGATRTDRLLRLTDADGVEHRIWLPGGEHVDREVLRFLEAHDVPLDVPRRVPPRAVLDAARVARTHDSDAYRLDPVVAPLSPPVLALIASMPILAALIATGFAVALGSWAPGLVALALATVAGVGLAAVSRQVIGVDITVAQRRLVVETRTRLGSERWSAPLDDVLQVTVDGTELVLHTRDGEHRVPLLGRSDRTRAEVAALIEDHRVRQRLEAGTPADVPDGLRALVGRTRQTE